MHDIRGIANFDATQSTLFTHFYPDGVPKLLITFVKHPLFAIKNPLKWGVSPARFD
jgi:hypothetical protein